jgi:hypothetical protein
MAITSVKTGSSFTNLIKYNDFLGPNAAYNPSSFESIATLTPSSGTTVSFTSIPSTYTSLQIRGVLYSDGNLQRFRLNSDSGTNYVNHWLYGDSTASVVSGANTAQTWFGLQVGSRLSTDGGLAFVVDILDYASTTKNKTVRMFYGFDNNGNNVNQVTLQSGLWLSTTAVNSVSVVSSGSGFATGTTISLYGIKGA